MSSPPPTVACPTCSRAVEWSAASPWRPFCSERCKLIDLGEWMSETRRVAGESVDIASEDADPEPGAEQ